jgi:hypothetical protein
MPRVQVDDVGVSLEPTDVTPIWAPSRMPVLVILGLGVDPTICIDPLVWLARQRPSCSSTAATKATPVNPLMPATGPRPTPTTSLEAPIAFNRAPTEFLEREEL